MAASPDLLIDLPLFRLLDDVERTELASAIEYLQVPSGRTVYRHGDPGDSVYVIVSGTVEIFLKEHTGRKIILENAERGDFFGELSFLDNGSRSATVVATEDLEVLIMDRNDLHGFLKKHPDAGLEILAALGARFRKMVERLQHSASRNVNDEIEVKRSKIERCADWIANFSGSLAFLGLHILWFTSWITINLGWIPGVEVFDAYPFGLLTMIVSLEAIVLSVFVLLSQSRQASHDRLRSDVEYDVNLRAELEICHLHEKMDRLTTEILVKLEGQAPPKATPKYFE